MSYIYQQVDVYSFCDSFQQLSACRGNFSHDGLIALFMYLGDLAEDVGEPIELDPIALCSEFTEYESWEAFQKDCSFIESLDIESLDKLRDYTEVIEFDGGLIVKNF